MVVSLSFSSIAATTASLSASASETKLLKGDQVTITVSLQDCPSAKSMALQFGFDESVFSIASAEWTLSGSVFDDFDSTNNAAAIVYAKETNMNGDVFTIVLEVKEDAPLGDTSFTVTPTIKKDTETYDCDSASVSLEILSCIHNLQNVKAKESTCSEQGWDAYSVCTKCGQIFSAEGEALQDIPYRDKLDHTGGTATCISPAVCSVCGEEYGKIDPDNHVGETETRNETEATCTDPGYTGDVYCLDCKQLISAGKSIDALGHDYVAEVTEPTCQAGGYTTYTCSVCGDTYTDDETDPIDHDYVAEVTEPTCQAGGYTTYTCSMCGDTYTGDETDPIEHDYVAEVTEPTCQAGGYTTYTCSMCGDTYTGDETDPIEHDYVAEVTEPTCTEGGYTTYTCSMCGDSYTDDETDSLGHDYVGEITEPTCKEQGYTTYTCSRCGDSYVDDYTDTTDHSF